MRIRLAIALLLAILTAVHHAAAAPFFRIKAPTGSFDFKNQFQKFWARWRPHQDDRYWHGFDIDGYTKNG